MPDRLQGGVRMKIDQLTDFDVNSGLHRWRLEWWGLVRGLVLLFSAFLGVTTLYFLILAVFRG
jgi:hypothetical protein